MDRERRGLLEGRGTFSMNRKSTSSPLPVEN